MPQSATATAQQREQAAARTDKLGCLPMDQRRNQRPHHQGDADGNSNAKRHPEIAHGEAVAHIPDSPHAAKQKSPENDTDESSDP